MRENEKVRDSDSEIKVVKMREGVKRDGVRA